ncbi:DUF1722 domain-containing protein [Candidatus Thorarchaeota archaeon]|nr:MAG: DUF1722 domain-containing protein [Candidatus Thorarchaeota archaeon]
MTKVKPLDRYQMPHPRPKLYASKCLGFCNCWWNGQKIFSDFVEKVKPFVDFVTHCPEVEIGLGSPRKWLRIVVVDGEKRFVQPSTGSDYTDEMTDYIGLTVPALPPLDGFILRMGSPSCSMKGIKYYQGVDPKARVVGEGPGLFGDRILHKYGGYPVESDGRLRNQQIREDFLIRVFLLASLREVEEKREMRYLADFHSTNKYLLKAFSQKHLNILGNIVANRGNGDLATILNKYRKNLLEATSKSLESSSVVNVLYTIYGYFKEALSDDEKSHFHERIESYRNGVGSIVSLTEMVRLWAIRFGDEYIKKQTFFEPFPQALNEICKMDRYQTE